MSEKYSNGTINYKETNKQTYLLQESGNFISICTHFVHNFVHPSMFCASCICRIRENCEKFKNGLTETTDNRQSA